MNFPTDRRILKAFSTCTMIQIGKFEVYPNRISEGYPNPSIITADVELEWMRTCCATEYKAEKKRVIEKLISLKLHSVI